MVFTFIVNFEEAWIEIKKQRPLWNVYLMKLKATDINVKTNNSFKGFNNGLTIELIYFLQSIPVWCTQTFYKWLITQT